MSYVIATDASYAGLPLTGMAPFDPVPGVCQCREPLLPRFGPLPRQAHGDTLGQRRKRLLAGPSLQALPGTVRRPHVLKREVLMVVKEETHGSLFAENLTFDRNSHPVDLSSAWSRTAENAVVLRYNEGATDVRALVVGEDRLAPFKWTLEMKVNGSRILGLPGRFYSLELAVAVAEVEANMQISMARGELLAGPGREAHRIPVAKAVDAFVARQKQGVSVD